MRIYSRGDSHYHKFKHMTIDEKVERYNEIKIEQADAEAELRRINAFLNRRPDNRDNARAIDKGKIFVKFASTACLLPVGLFTAELNKRKKDIEDRLVELNNQLEE